MGQFIFVADLKYYLNLSVASSFGDFRIPSFKQTDFALGYPRGIANMAAE